jgi:predicted dinucleotide-utilizing enzyme
MMENVRWRRTVTKACMQIFIWAYPRNLNFSLKIEINSAKKETFLFQDPVFQREVVKIQITSQIFIVKGLNTVSIACSMNHKQLMNLWNGR